MKTWEKILVIAGALFIAWLVIGGMYAKHLEKRQMERAREHYQDWATPLPRPTTPLTKEQWRALYPVPTAEQQYWIDKRDEINRKRAR